MSKQARGVGRGSLSSGWRVYIVPGMDAPCRADGMMQSGKDAGGDDDV